MHSSIQKSLSSSLCFFLLSNTPTFAQTEEQKDALERSQATLTRAVRQIANSIDSFFSTERHSWADNKSRVSVQGDADWIDNHGWEFKPRIRANVKFPGLNDRIRLVANEVRSDGAPGGESVDDDAQVALRWIGKTGRRNGISFGLGLSGYGEPSIQGFGRVNYYHRWGAGLWNIRLQNRLYYYQESKLRNDFRFFFERPLSDNLFFRSRTRFDYSEEKDEQWYPSQTFSLFHKINDRAAVVWEALAQQTFTENVVFDADEFLRPCSPKCDTYLLRARFRQNIGYPWLFYEVWPAANWPEARDYEFTPSIRFRLEIILGDPPERIAIAEH